MTTSPKRNAKTYFPRSWAGFLCHLSKQYLVFSYEERHFYLTNDIWHCVSCLHLSASMRVYPHGNMHMWQGFFVRIILGIFCQCLKYQRGKQKHNYEKNLFLQWWITQNFKRQDYIAAIFILLPFTSSSETQSKT